MQLAGSGMGVVHTVDAVLLSQQPVKLGDVSRQVFDGNSCVFHDLAGLGIPRQVVDEALAGPPQFPDLRAFRTLKHREGVAKPCLLETFPHRGHVAASSVRVGMLKLHDEHRARLAHHKAAVAGLLEVVFRAAENLVVDQLAAGQLAAVRVGQPWPALHHDHRRSQGLVDALAVHTQQGSRRREGDQAELILHSEEERAFGARQQPAEVEGHFALRLEARRIEQGIEGIAGVAAGDLRIGKALADRLPRGLIAEQVAEPAVDTSLQRIRRFALRRKLPGGQRTEADLRPVGKKATGAHEVVAGGAVGDGVGAAGVVAHHAADHRPVGSRGFGAEEEPVWSEETVELIADNARLHPHPPPLKIEAENAVHMTASINHDATAHDLPSQRRARSPRDDADPLDPSKADQLTDICIRLRKGHSLRLLLILRGVGRVDPAGYPIAPHLPFKDLAQRRIPSPRRCHTDRVFDLRHHHHSTTTPVMKDPIIPARCASDGKTAGG